MHRSTVTRLAAAALAGWASLSLAQPGDQPPQDLRPPELAGAVLKSLEAPYLTDQERREFRVQHGIWRDEDLTTPALRAKAALIDGRWNDPSLVDPATPVEDRAAAMVLRGEMAEAIAALQGVTTPRSLRLLAQACEAIGRFQEAGDFAEQAALAFAGSARPTAAHAADAALALMVRTRVKGQDKQGGGDFKDIMSILGHAREKLDRLSWEVMVAEAELLLEKDNPAQAREAALQALAHNPRCARAWEILGQQTINAFAFEATRGVVARLDSLARGRADEGPGSPIARRLEALAAFRENDPQAADEAMGAVLKQYPRVPWAHALLAGVAAEELDQAKTDQRLANFDALAPGSPEAHLVVGCVLSENRQYEWAAHHLEEASKRLPTLARPHVELGLLALQWGRDDMAVASLQVACALDPFNVRAANSLKLVRELAAYPRVESDHFIVRYAPGVDSVLAREMLPILERIHARVCGDGPGGIDHEPAHKTLIELLPDHASFAVRIAGISQIHTIAAATGPVIAMEAPRAGPGHSTGPYDWARVIQHEYTHTVTLSRTRNRIPHWFTEAAAVHLEDSPRDWDRCMLLARSLIQGELLDLDEINLRFVRPIRPTDRALAYAQGHWMYEYTIHRFGPRSVLDLMDQYARGVREEEAFQATLGVSRSRFFEEFRAWATQEVTRWGLLPPGGVPLLKQLLLREAARSEPDALVRSLRSWSEEAAWSSLDAESDAASARNPEVEITDELLGRLRTEYPGHPEVLRLAVERASEAAGGAPGESDMDLLMEYSRACPVDPTPRRHLARICLALGRGEEAIEHLEYLDQRETYSGVYAVELARQHARRKDWDRATEKAERAVTIDPFRSDYRELAASVALQRSDLATALRHVEALTAIEPDRQIHRDRLDAIRRRQNP